MIHRPMYESTVWNLWDNILQYIYISSCIAHKAWNQNWCEPLTRARKELGSMFEHSNYWKTNKQTIKTSKQIKNKNITFNGNLFLAMYWNLLKHTQTQTNKQTNKQKNQQQQKTSKQINNQETKINVKFYLIHLRFRHLCGQNVK